MKTDDGHKAERLVQEYLEIFKDQKNGESPPYEWQSTGDYFKKFSLFTDHRPTVVSTHTVVNKKK